jgi:hypothetical protein
MYGAKEILRPSDLTFCLYRVKNKTKYRGIPPIQVTSAIKNHISHQESQSKRNIKEKKLL